MVQVIVFTCNMLTELHHNIICQAMYGILLMAKVHIKLMQICQFRVASHPHFDAMLDWFCRQVLDLESFPLKPITASSTVWFLPGL